MIKYKITYQNPTRQYIPIEAIIPCGKEDEIELQFPAWRPGRYELGNFAKNIHLFKVSDEKGKALNFIKTSKDSWKVSCKKVGNIKVSYSYYAAELNAGSTFMDDRQIYVNPVNCLIYRKELQDKPCELELVLPDNFKLACGASNDGRMIVTKNYHELVDSPFIGSASLQHHTYEVEGMIFNIWFQGDVHPDWNKITTDFERFTRKQLEKFGNFRKKYTGFPADEYHFLYQILAVKAYHGVEHQTSTVIALGPGADLMESIYDDFLGVSSHELYHAWNIKSIRPAEMHPYDYSKENYSRLGYVAEGVTTYMGDLFLCESGVRDFRWYKKELEKLLQRHFDNFGRFNYSVAESSWDTWLDGYSAGAPNRKVSIYTEGALLSFVTDIKIRTNSNNKLSLHDVMRRMYEDFAKKDKGYTEADFEKIVTELAGEDLRSYFASYYYGTHSFEPILTKAFEQIGLEIKMKENPSVSCDILGIKSLVSTGKTVVKQLYPGGSAELGGIMLEDEIVAVNGTAVAENLDHLVRFYAEKELCLTLNRMGRLLDIICPNTNKSYFPAYELHKVKAPSNLQKRIFKSWSGHSWDEID